MNAELARAIKAAERERLENEFLFQARACGLPEPARQVIFHPERKWRWDFVFPGKVAVELMGGVYSGGAHTRGKGYEEDCVKANEGVRLGWAVLRFTGAQVETGAAVRAVEAFYATREPSGPSGPVETPHGAAEE